MGSRTAVQTIFVQEVRPVTAIQSTAVLDQLSEQEYRKRIRAWTLYDWANSAFSTTIMAAVLPVYYSTVAGATLRSEAQATQYWAFGLSASVFIIALLSPILGTVSDIKRGKKKFLALFTTLGVIGTGLLVLVGTGDWLLASLFFVLGRIGNGAANVFYDALLPHVAKADDQDRVSSLGYALGYLGGGLLLAVNVAMIFFLPGTLGARLSFLSVAVWWAVFSIPLFRNVPEPEAATERLKPGESIVAVSLTRLRSTLSEIREYRELFKYLVAYLIYNDGIGTVIGIAAIYGAELGFDSVQLILALLLVQFVGIPYSLIFGNLPNEKEKRRPQFLAFILFNIVMLPAVALTGTRLLPPALTGTPSPPFAATATAVGEGSFSVADTAVFTATGTWQAATFSAEQRGAEAQEGDVVYVTSTAAGDQLDITFNGQKAGVTYQAGPQQGIFAVLIDGEPLLEDGEPLMVDAYNSTVRFDERVEFVAASEGEHTLSLRNTGEANPDATGTAVSIAQVEVLSPLRTSNLLAIIGLLLAVELVGLLFAFALGKPLFSGLARTFDTQRSILLAVFVYALIAIWGFALNSVIEYWFLAWMVAIVQGGSQALSRSLYASLSPPSMSGEFFGLFSIMSKFASIISPLLFVIAIALFDSSRPGILSVVILFIIGGILLSRVNVPEGKRMAAEKEAEMMRAARAAAD